MEKLKKEREDKRKKLSKSRTKYVKALSENSNEKTLSDRLREARTLAGSHTALSYLMGISSFSLQRFINGDQPSHDALKERVNNYLTENNI